MRLVALALAAFSVACGGPSVGELVSLEVSATLRAVSSDSGSVALGEPDGGAAVTRAFVSARSLSWLPCNDDIAALEVGPALYDLLAEPVQGERVTTAVQNFCGLRLELAPSEEVAEGFPEGVSMQVEGTTEEGAPFTLASSASTSFLLEAEDGEAFGQVPLLLGFDVAKWLGDLPLPENLSELRPDVLEEQLATAVSAYLDEDEDGRLDAEESRPLLRAHAP